MNKFLQRLKQRKLVQWGMAYVAAAFALLQGIEVVAQQFGWPEGVRRGITLALVVGFFVALVLAWYHGERGAQRVNGTELLILALLLALGGGFLWRFAGASKELGMKPAVDPNDTATLTISNKSQQLLSIPHGGGPTAVPLTPAVLRLDPMFDSLRNDPRFQQLIADGEAATSAKPKP